MNEEHTNYNSVDFDNIEIETDLIEKVYCDVSGNTSWKKKQRIKNELHCFGINTFDVLYKQLISIACGQSHTVKNLQKRIYPKKFHFIVKYYISFIEYKLGIDFGTTLSKVYPIKYASAIVATLIPQNIISRIQERSCYRKRNRIRLYIKMNFNVKPNPKPQTQTQNPEPIFLSSLKRQLTKQTQNWRKMKLGKPVDFIETNFWFFE